MPFRSNSYKQLKYGKLSFSIIAGLLIITMMSAFVLNIILEREDGTKWLMMIIGGLSLTVLLFLIEDRKTFLMGFIAFSTMISLDIGLRGRPTGFHGTSTLTLNLTHILMALMYVLWAIEAVREKTGKIHVKFIPLISFALFIAWSGLSATKTTPDMQGVEINKMVPYVLNFFLFFYLVNNIRKFKHFRAILIGLSAGLLLHSAQGLVQAATGRLVTIPLITAGTATKHATGAERVLKGATTGGEVRIEGGAKHPNALARKLSLFIPVLLLVALFYKKELLLRLFFAGTAFLALISVLLSLSRSGWGALYFALAYGSILLAYKYKVLAKVVVAAIFIHLIAAVPILTTDNPISRRIAETGVSFEEQRGSAYSRIYHFQAAYNYISNNPMLGVGLGMYARELDKYDNTPLQMAYHGKVSVHNTFLFFAGESGLPALVLILTFFGSVFYYGHKLANHPSPLAKLIGVGLNMGLLSTYIALTYTAYPLEYLTSIWVPLAAICAIYLNPHLFRGNSFDD